jgi:hypothetical protein
MDYSYGLELCTMYDSHDVYLCVLWTICMYKFSRCHAVVFTVFFVQFTDFWQKLFGNRHTDFQAKPVDLSVKSAAFRSSRFSLFLRRLRCVSAEFYHFFKFCKNRQNL